VQEESGDVRNTTLDFIEVLGGMPKRSGSYSITNKGLLRIGDAVLGPGSKVFYNKEPGRTWMVDKLNFGEDPPSVDILPVDVSSNGNVAPRNTILDNIEPYDFQQWLPQKNAATSPQRSPATNPIVSRSVENFPSKCHFPSDRSMESSLNNQRESARSNQNSLSPGSGVNGPMLPRLPENLPRTTNLQNSAQRTSDVHPSEPTAAPHLRMPVPEEKESTPSYRTEGSSVFVGDSELRVGTPVIYEKTPHLKWFIVKVYAEDVPPTFDIHETASNRAVNTTIARIKPLCTPKKSATTTTTQGPDEDAGLCIVCMEKESTHALIPCGHKSYCALCAEKLELCALCRQKVSGHLRVFQ